MSVFSVLLGVFESMFSQVSKARSSHHGPRPPVGAPDLGHPSSLVRKGWDARRWDFLLQASESILQKWPVNFCDSQIGGRRGNLPFFEKKKTVFVIFAGS